MSDENQNVDSEPQDDTPQTQEPDDAAPAAETTGTDTTLDLSAFMDDALGLLYEVLGDFTSQEAQDALAKVATDWAAIAKLKIDGADPSLIDEAETALTARYRALVKIPGLIAAGRQGKAIDILSRMGKTVINWGFAVLRSYIPVIPTSFS